MMARNRFASAVLLLTLALGGCQGVGGLVVSAPASAPDIAPADENVPNRLGREHLAAGDNGLAERQFREAVERNPNDSASWIGLAAAYDNLGRFDLADRAYGQAIRSGGETLEIINNRGYSYLLRGDGRRAKVLFERALALDPSNAVIANNLQLLQLGQRNARGTAL